MNDFVRIRRIVLTLSSEHEGEVVAAARALGKILAREGLDWHWIGERIGQQSVPASAAPPPESSAGPRRSWNQIGAAEIATALLATEHLLQGYEAKVFRQMLGWIGTPTPRELGWMQKLAKRTAWSP